jgi:hypothetical protein
MVRQRDRAIRCPGRMRPLEKAQSGLEPLASGRAPTLHAIRTAHDGVFEPYPFGSPSEADAAAFGRPGSEGLCPTTANYSEIPALCKIVSELLQTLRNSGRLTRYNVISGGSNQTLGSRQGVSQLGGKKTFADANRLAAVRHPENRTATQSSGSRRRRKTDSRASNPRRCRRWKSRKDGSECGLSSSSQSDLSPPRSACWRRPLLPFLKELPPQVMT